MALKTLLALLLIGLLFFATIYLSPKRANGNGVVVKKYGNYVVLNDSGVLTEYPVGADFSGLVGQYVTVGEK